MDIYEQYPELLATEPPKHIKTLFGYKWSQGFVSPYRPCPPDATNAILSILIQLNSPNLKILDLGCG